MSSVVKFGAITVFGWLAGLVLPAVATAATLTLSAVDDASIYEGNPAGDLGATTLLAGTNQLFQRGRAMFRFDTAAIPAGAVISEVQVQLYVTRRPDPDQHGGPVDSDFSLYRMFVSWGEGSGSNATGSVALPGAATWNERHFGSTAWATPGGQIGTDFADTPSATTFIGNVGPYSWATTSELVDDVRSWVANPASNFGFMIISQSEGMPGSGRRFGSTEQPAGTIPPPQLVVTYTLVPEPSSLLLVLGGCMGFITLRRRDPNCRQR